MEMNFPPPHHTDTLFPLIVDVRQAMRMNALPLWIYGLKILFMSHLGVKFVILGCIKKTDLTLRANWETPLNSYRPTSAEIISELTLCSKALFRPTHMSHKELISQ